MASTTNPFVSALNSFAADPEAEAKGRYIQANTAKTQNEADILADRKKWRALFGQAGDLNPTVRAGELSNDRIDVTGAYKGNAAAGGAKMLFDTDASGNLVPKTDMWGRQAPVDPKTFSLASLLMGHAPSEVTSRAMGSGGFDKPIAAPKVDYKLAEYTDQNSGVVYRQDAHEDGSPKFYKDGTPVMTPLNPDTKKISQPSVAGGKAVETTVNFPDVKDKDGKVIGRSKNGVQTNRELTLPGSNVINGSQLAQAARMAHAADEARRGKPIDGMSDVEFLAGKRIGSINADGTANKGRPALNPDEMDSIEHLVQKIMASDPTIPLSVAVTSAMDHHEDIAKGEIVTKDYDNRGWFDNFLGLGGADNEKDAAGVELPQFGKDKEFTTSKNYKRALGVVPEATANRGKYSNIKDDTVIVPSGVRLSEQAKDDTSMAALLSGATGKPEYAEQIVRDAAGNPTGLKAGQFYHDKGKFYVADIAESGKVVARLVTNSKE